MFRLSILAAIVVVLLTGAAMYHSGPSIQAASSKTPYQSLPDDVIFVMHADIRALVDSELYQSVSHRFGENPLPVNAQYREFVEATGFHFETDLASVTIGVSGDLADDSPSFYMLLKGEFDREKIDAFIRNSGEYEQQQLDGLVAFVGQAAAAGQEISAAIAWLDDDTLLVTSSSDLGKLVRSIDGRAPNAADSVLGRLLAGAEGQIQLAMVLPEAEEQDPGETPLPSMVQSIVESVRNSPLGRLESIMVTLNAGSGLDLSVKAEANTPEDGTAVYEMLNGYLAMGRMMAAENPQFGLFLDRLELQRNEAVVSLGVSMTGDEIRAAMEQNQPQAVAAEPAGS